MPVAIRSHRDVAWSAQVFQAGELQSKPRAAVQKPGASLEQLAGTLLLGWLVIADLLVADFTSKPLLSAPSLVFCGVVGFQFIARDRKSVV